VGVALRRVFVLGGARSGKSGFAERLAAECGEPVLYVATATAGDAEMAERIALHRAQRPPAWRTLEVPVDVAAALRGELERTERGAGTGGHAPTVLIEDLTLLLSNLMSTEHQHPTQRQPDSVLSTQYSALSTSDAEARAIREVEELCELAAHVILVSNEVGMGIVPPSPSGRMFRDALGRVNQRAAALCSEAYLLVAGVPLRLK
jgi:adenosylcobinamide kinase/adenosylcobinamide-phosphate guanylyltransferase